MSALRLFTKAAFARHCRATAIPVYLHKTTVAKRFQSNLPAQELIGVAAAVAAGDGVRHKATIFSREFALNDRVAMVTGGHGGIGLEASLALIEAGARAVYCIDLPQTPSATWRKVQKYAEHMDGKLGEGRLEYIRGDVTDQEAMWKIGESIGDKEGRMDICVAAAGISGDLVAPLDCTAANHNNVLSVNTGGAFYAAQAAGKQMIRFGNGGSITLIASVAGTITIRIKRHEETPLLSYGASKAALLQTARTLACSLASQGIRVNTLSPGWIKTSLATDLIEESASFLKETIPFQRAGEPRELRGVITWLSSDASSYCTGSDIMVSGGLSAW